MVFDYEEHRLAKEHRSVYFATKGKKKCPKCNYFLCTCQSILKDYKFESIKIIKEFTLQQKIKHCPFNCLNHNKKCVPCYMYNNFEMVVKI